jgi:hypothetical protein
MKKKNLCIYRIRALNIRFLSNLVTILKHFIKKKIVHNHYCTGITKTIYAYFCIKKNQS